MLNAATESKPQNRNYEQRLSLAMLMSWGNASLFFVFLNATYVANFDLVTAFFLFLLLVAPICWLIRIRKFATKQNKTTTGNDSKNRFSSRRFRLACAFIIGFSSLASSVATSFRPVSDDEQLRFVDAVPVIHDEFSYLLQAETLLAGRWWWSGPSHCPEIFHQIHVLNEGRVASRYLPGTGAWIAPWLVLGKPVWGHWVAGAIVSILIFLIGCELRGIIAGFVSGMLAALSPGMAILSNLLLSHHPAMMGLMLFLLFFLRMMKSYSLRDALGAGTGLAFAMLCRPLTAAALGLPFGIWCLVQVSQSIRNRSSVPISTWVQCCIGLWIPLAIGFSIVGAQNKAITGNIFTTPYLLYQKLYTPNHVYGFDNVERGQHFVTEKTVTDYNDWATNLTPRKAVDISLTRFTSSMKWALGYVPLSLTIAFVFFSFHLLDVRHKLIALAIAALHLFYFPYWLDGILKCHYVFESILLWLILLGSFTDQLLHFAVRRGRMLFVFWWGGLIAISILINHASSRSEFFVSPIQAELVNIAKRSQRYKNFEKELLKIEKTPTLVLVEYSSDDVHIEYIRNAPDYHAEILVARYKPDQYSLKYLIKSFPERAIYLFNADQGTLTPLKHQGVQTP